MKYTFWIICEPGMDRPCFSHTPPEEYKKKPGSKVFEATMDLPSFIEVDGHLEVKTE